MWAQTLASHVVPSPLLQCLFYGFVKLCMVDFVYKDFDNKDEYMLDVPVYMLLQALHLSLFSVGFFFYDAENAAAMFLLIGLSRCSKLLSLFIRFRKHNKVLRIEQQLIDHGRLNRKPSRTEAENYRTLPNSFTGKEFVSGVKDCAFAFLSHLVLAAPLKSAVNLLCATICFLVVSGRLTKKFFNWRHKHYKTSAGSMSFAATALAPFSFIASEFAILVFYQSDVNLFYALATVGFVEHLLDLISDVYYFKVMVAIYTRLNSLVPTSLKKEVHYNDAALDPLPFQYIQQVTSKMFREHSPSVPSIPVTVTELSGSQ